jgi:ankyrin repeat protein
MRLEVFIIFVLPQTKYNDMKNVISERRRVIKLEEFFQANKDKSWEPFRTAYKESHISDAQTYLIFKADSEEIDDLSNTISLDDFIRANNLIEDKEGNFTLQE